MIFLTFLILHGSSACPQTAVHEDLLQHCMDGLKASYDKVSAFDRDKDGTRQFDQEVSCMIRLMTQLHEYVTKFDNNHSEGLADLSLSRSVSLSLCLF